MYKPCQMEAGQRLGSSYFFQSQNLQTQIGMLGMVAPEHFKYLLDLFKSGLIYFLFNNIPLKLC